MRKTIFLRGKRILRTLIDLQVEQLPAEYQCRQKETEPDHPYGARCYGLFNPAFELLDRHSHQIR